MAQMRFLVATIFTLALASSLTLADSAGFPHLGDNNELFVAPSLQEPLSENRSLPEEAPTAVLSKLNLTETQRQQIQQIRQKYHEPIAQRLERVALAQRELSQMMVGIDSVAAIRAQHEDIAQLRQAIDDLRFESMLEMRNVFTLEQRQQFAQMMQRRKKVGKKSGVRNSLTPNP